jgi:RNA polymerase-associated protein
MVQSARSRTVLTLYTTADDIQCHRVRLLLAAKGVSYERAMVEPGKPPEDLIDLNPYASTPTLVDRDLTLYDTSVVCEYLDERYPHPPLMPIDPLSRARLRLAAVRIERDWLPEVDIIRAGGRPADAARKRLREQLLASLPLFKAAKFFLNPEMSLADCLVAPVVWRLPWLGVDLGKEGRPILDYGERLFHSQGYARSLTAEEKAMRP